ncbi:hypothetical protein DL769_001561 [Monosporascus sp. CRB-8-3]|nr:hypothetical protein DL769_001561 [Monosporascus sp. CRB-8-3]
MPAHLAINYRPLRKRRSTNCYAMLLPNPDAKNLRLQAWGHPANWNDILSILRKLRPQRQFIPDYPNPQYLTISADQSDSLALLKKWTGQDGWKPLESSITDSIENAWFE